MREGAATGRALPDVCMFWHGPALSRIERLCMTSFVANGHSVRLFAYEPPVGVPRGVDVLDAASVLPRSALEAHVKSRPLALFADRFRYELLFTRGGLWVDADVACLKPFDHAQTEIFGWQDAQTINNAVLGLPRGHALAECMLRVCEQPARLQPGDSLKMRRRKIVARLLGRDVKGQWGATGPQGMTDAARRLGYADRAQPFWHFYPVSYQNWHCAFDASLADNPGFVAASYGVHLWNEMARRAPGFDKNARFAPASLFEQLCRRYALES